MNFLDENISSELSGDNLYNIILFTLQHAITEYELKAIKKRIPVSFITKFNKWHWDAASTGFKAINNLCQIEDTNIYDKLYSITDILGSIMDRALNDATRAMGDFSTT